MSHPIVSGAEYRVATVNGLAPDGLVDFVGAVEMVLEHHGQQLSVLGLGALDRAAVRLTEKEDSLGGKDVRTWRIQPGDAGFAAVHDPAHG